MKARMPKGVRGGGPSNINDLVRKAQKMQADIEAAQNELKSKEYSATTGGGAVAITMNGAREVLKLEIKPEVVDPEDVELLQDMLIGAINEAGITRFISKPWNDYELIATLGQVLTLRELTLENQRLADQVRLEAGALSAEEIERKRLEAIEPGITRVIWGPDGSVLLDESLLDDAAH